MIRYSEIGSTYFGSVYSKINSNLLEIMLIEYNLLIKVSVHMFNNQYLIGTDGFEEDLVFLVDYHFFQI